MPAILTNVPLTTQPEAEDQAIEQAMTQLVHVLAARDRRDRQLPPSTEPLCPAEVAHYRRRAVHLCSRWVAADAVHQARTQAFQPLTVATKAEQRLCLALAESAINACHRYERGDAKLPARTIRLLSVEVIS